MWELLGGRVLFVTLTYPGDESWAPTSGKEAHEHLRAFLKRVFRHFGVCRCLWKKEFQRRGVLHYHLLVVVPSPWSEMQDKAGVRNLGELLGRWWWEVVGSGDADHLAAGTSVEWFRSNPGNYMAKYLNQKSKKEYQHQVPVGFKVGRWWGYVGIKRVASEVQISREEFVRLRRLSHKYRISRQRQFGEGKVRRRRWRGGVWSSGGVEPLVFPRQMLRCVGLECLVPAIMPRALDEYTGAWRVEVEAVGQGGEVEVIGEFEGVGEPPPCFGRN